MTEEVKVYWNDDGEAIEQLTNAITEMVKGAPIQVVTNVMAAVLAQVNETIKQPEINVIVPCNVDFCYHVTSTKVKVVDQEEETLVSKDEVIEHIPFPKIGDYRSAVKRVKELNKNNFKTLIFSGTPKLHGTNSSVCYNSNGDLWAQSRTKIITPENDNYGFAKFVEDNRNDFLTYMDVLSEDLGLSSGETLVLYGEWAGKGIQSGVAISELDKFFCIFEHCVFSEEGYKWVEPNDINVFFDTEANIYDMDDWSRFLVQVDIDNPKLSQNELADLTNQVEDSCPFAKVLGVSGRGEGIVWRAQFENEVIRFKVKGQKHSVTKVKTLANVDTEKLNSIIEFVEYAVTENRIDQAKKQVFGEDEPDIKKTGDIIRWVINDVITEEADTLKSNNINPKEIGKHISLKVKEFLTFL
jgi:hypothetical protein